jgi:hypothetical protein
MRGERGEKWRFSQTSTSLTAPLELGHFLEVVLVEKAFYVQKFNTFNLIFLNFGNVNKQLSFLRLERRQNVIELKLILMLLPALHH